MIWIIIIGIIVAAVVWVNKAIKKDQEKAIQAKKKRMELERKQQEKNKKKREFYWKHLCEVYDKESTAVLQKAIGFSYLTQIHGYERDYYYNRIGKWKKNEPGLESFRSGLYWDAIDKLRSLLKNPCWKCLRYIDNNHTEASSSTYPLYPELDIKYIKQLIAKRQNNQ